MRRDQISLQLYTLREETERDMAGTLREVSEIGYPAVEFAPLGGTTMWDVLVGETDPGLVHLELDLYWVKYGGADPENVLRDVAGRVSLVHLKDMAPDDTLSDLPVDFFSTHQHPI